MQSEHEAVLREESVVFLFASLTWLYWVFLKPCGCSLFSHELPQTPHHRKDELSRELLSAPVHWNRTNSAYMETLVVNACLPVMCWNSTRWKSNRQEVKSLTCSEKEHGHSAVVLPLRPPAQGNQGYQEGHQSCHAARDQQHQGGNLPVCRDETYAG